MRWVLPSIVLAMPGCMPFVLPPSRVEVGTSPNQQYVPDVSGEQGHAASPAAAPGSGPQTGAVLVRAGVHPLQVVPKLAGRRVDVGVGYMLEGTSDPDLVRRREGPYVELGAFPIQARLGANSRVRAGAVAVGEYFVRDDQGYRAGIGAAGTVEVVAFSKGAFESSDGSSRGVETSGWSYGEWAIGAFAGPTVRVGNQMEQWSGTFGISARMPFAIGVACCFDPTDHFKPVRQARGHHGRARTVRFRSRNPSPSRATDGVNTRP